MPKVVAKSRKFFPLRKFTPRIITKPTTTAMLKVYRHGDITCSVTIQGVGFVYIVFVDVASVYVVSVYGRDGPMAAYPGSQVMVAGREARGVLICEAFLTNPLGCGYHWQAF